MARTYTQETVLDAGQLKEEDFNGEIQGFAQEYNGQLDQHQLPLQSVTHTHLVQPTVKTPFVSVNGTYSSYMASQSYHQSEWVQGEFTPSMQFDNSLYTGFSWIKLQALQLQSVVNPALTGGAQISFDALEGMIIGCAVIDFDWFSGEATITSDGLNTVSNYGNSSVIEWGVFIDDVLVSKSGFIWPRRMTLNLPFSAPISSKPVVVDIRFKAQFIDPTALVSASAVAVSAQIARIQKLSYKGGNLWARNQYR